jgi:hypothetical protein
MNLSFIKCSFKYSCSGSLISMKTCNKTQFRLIFYARVHASLYHHYDSILLKTILRSFLLKQATRWSNTTSLLQNLRHLYKAWKDTNDSN